MERKRVVIGLGGNVGERERYLQQARERIALRIGRIVAESTVIETEAWGFVAPPFLNQVIVVETVLPPLTLLDELQSIERLLGRTEKSAVINGKSVYHNRTVDIDILDYDGLRYHDERLTLPHPRVHEREFVLKSLRELNLNI